VGIPGNPRIDASPASRLAGELADDQRRYDPQPVAAFEELDPVAPPTSTTSSTRSPPRTAPVRGHRIPRAKHH